jgi:Rad3-related DNA helicase
MDLDEYNIYPKYRMGQKEAIQHVLDAYEKIRSGEIKSKVVELAAPTAMGKTIVNRAIGLALLEQYPDTFQDVVYTTPLRNLVKQIRDETALGIPTVMGRSNYPCIAVPGLDAGECPFRTAALMKQRPKECNHCEYTVAKRQFKSAAIKACTLDFALYNTLPVDMYIFDESTGIEDKLLNHFELVLPNFIDLSNLPNSIHRWMLDMFDEKEEFENELESIMKRRKDSNDAKYLKLLQEATRKLNRIDRQIDKASRIMLLAKNPDDYYVDDSRKFKLIYGKPLFDSLIKQPRLVIMSSGTPNTSLLCDNFTRVEAPHPIPASRRQVFYQPVGKMSRANQDKTIPAMAAKILEIHKSCPKQTIVHCHSFGLGLKLRDAMNSPLVLLQERNMREESLEQFMAAKECIWLCMAYDEGLNLAGSRFQVNIIPKVPYPGLEGWVKRRNESDIKKYNFDLWYRMTTAISIQQAAGRTTRSPDDYSQTFILDANFGYFYSQNKQYFEDWFKKSLIWRKKE